MNIYHGSSKDNNIIEQELEEVTHKVNIII